MRAQRCVTQVNIPTAHDGMHTVNDSALVEYYSAGMACLAWRQLMEASAALTHS
jgi:hypothetical protein